MDLAHRIVRPSGEIRDVHTRARLGADAAGQWLLSGTIEDITEIKESRKKLRQNETLLQMAERMAHIGGWEVELPEGRVIWSDQVFAILDLAPGTPPTVEEAINFCAPECRARIREVFEACTRDGRPYDEELQIITATGRRIWARTIGEASRDGSNAITRVHGAFQDITEKKQIEEKALRLANRLTSTLESITDAFLTLDREWRFTYINREAERLLQRTRADLLGRNVWEEFKEAVGSIAYLEYHRALRENCAVMFEKFNPPLGRWFEVKAYPSEEGLAVYFRDITDRKQAGLALIRSNRAFQMLSRCNEALIRVQDESELIERICRIAVDIGGYRMAWVGYAQEDEARRITVEAYAGDEDARNYLQGIAPSWAEEAPTGRGPAGRTIRSGVPIVVEDIEQDATFSPWLPAARQCGYRGAVYLPLRDKDRAFGLLTLYAGEVIKGTPEEIGLLQELADNLAFGISHIRTRDEQRHVQSTILKVAASVSASTGEKFFEQLARNMAEAVGAQGGFVSRLLPTEPLTARTIIAVMHGARIDDFEYVVGDAPCDKVLRHNRFVIPFDAAEQYPRSPPAALGAKAYGGWRLDSSDGRPIGLLFVLFLKPVQDSDFITSTLQIFAARAAAELERRESDARLRDLASLLDKAQDAIIVRNIEGSVLFWNKSAERLYGWTQQEVLGRSLETLLNDDPAAFEEATRRVLKDGDWSGEFTRTSKAGSTLTVEARWTLVKDDDDRPKSILSINTDITQRKNAEREIQQLAFYDPLTGLPNRQLMLDRLQHAMALSGRTRHTGALLFIDLDNFKTINDTLGHDKGDLLLQQVASRLQSCVYKTDTVARFGGDEFMVMLENLDDLPRKAGAQAKAIGEKILAALNQPFPLDGYEHYTTSSIGLTLFDNDRIAIGELLKRADLAMYQAKASGRNALRFFDPEMQTVVNVRVTLEADLRQALAQREFILHYQPQLDGDGRVTGSEALVRWHHPQRGLVSPASFIPLAEETGLILPLGRWVLATACAQLAIWARRPETADLSVAVNVSARQLRHTDFVEQVLTVLEETGADPRKLKLELTESLLLDNVEVTIAKMAALKAKGVCFSLDDFGTGYSSLAYLKRLPLDQLKIDQSFVRDVLTDPNDAAIARTILALGQHLNLSVMAEGVETEGQRDFLAQHGCHSYQGYLFSRPLAADQFDAFMLSRMQDRGTDSGS